MSRYALPRPAPLDLNGKRFAAIVSLWHQPITDKLLEGALETLADHGVASGQLEVFQVPGAWELPLATQAALRSGRFHGVVSLGCVIRGETTHDQYINRFVSESLGRMSLEHNIPVGFGLLTCETREQAVERSGGSVGNKGVEATLAMLEMIRLLDSFCPASRT